VKLLRTTGVSVRLALALVIALQATVFGLPERWYANTPVAHASSFIADREVPDTSAQMSTSTPSLDQLTANSDRIVVGTVAERRSYWNDEHSGIYTSIAFSVEETLKGTANANAITVTYRGGQAGGLPSM
jgi:hypothetical protein